MNRIAGGTLFLALMIIAGCASGPPPAAGVWGVEIDVPQMGVIPVTLTLNEDGAGNMSAAALGEAPVSDIEYDGSNVTFVVDIDAPGQSFVLEFSGIVEGDMLEGSFGSDFGEMAVTGTRQ